jgi:hypothetical protein
VYKLIFTNTAADKSQLQGKIGRLDYRHSHDDTILPETLPPPAVTCSKNPHEISRSQAQGSIMATVPQSLAGLSLAEKRMLLAQLLQEKADQSATVFPLSYGQRGLWFLHQMDRQGASYNVCYPSRIRSPLDLAAFRRAVQKLIDRHPGLRTTF